MRHIAFLGFLLLLPACTGEWGDWMQADKPDPDHQFFCGFYDDCGKSKTKTMYESDHSLKENSDLYGTTKSSDLYGK